MYVYLCAIDDGAVVDFNHGGREVDEIDGAHVRGKDVVECDGCRFISITS